MEETELIAKLMKEMNAYADALVFRAEDTPDEEVTDSDNAINDAVGETGWPIETLGDKTSYWFKYRVKRHLLFYLWTGMAKKFQAKSFSLQHKFDHLERILKKMDEEWEKFKEENLALFATDDIVNAFGTVIGTGLTYTETGREIVGVPTIHPQRNS